MDIVFFLVVVPVLVSRDTPGRIQDCLLLVDSAPKLRALLGVFLKKGRFSWECFVTFLRSILCATSIGACDVRTHKLLNGF